MTDFYQILFKEEQRAKLYPFATPYFNTTLTPFFENAIIQELVMQSTADKIAVCSWALKDKRTGVIPPKRELTAEVLEEDFDVMSFTKNTGSHEMLGALDAWHAGCSEILRKIWSKLGLPMPLKPKFPIYQNAFCARTEIYQEYVTKFLSPAMFLMENDADIRELCYQDAKYTRTILGKDVDMVRIKELLGLDFYPLHAFLLERCFSLWIDNLNLKIVYL